MSSAESAVEAAIRVLHAALRASCGTAEWRERARCRGAWRIAPFQNTPAAFHDRPEVVA